VTVSQRTRSKDAWFSWRGMSHHSFTAEPVMNTWELQTWTLLCHWDYYFYKYNMSLLGEWFSNCSQSTKSKHGSNRQV
jgi:hypothetical protein